MKTKKEKEKKKRIRNPDAAERFVATDLQSILIQPEKVTSKNEK